jgi:hypothetical protein
VLPDRGQRSEVRRQENSAKTSLNCVSTAPAVLTSAREALPAMLRARVVRSQGVNGLTIQSRLLFVSVKNPAICREASIGHNLDYCC